MYQKNGFIKLDLEDDYVCNSMPSISFTKTGRLRINRSSLSKLQPIAFLTFLYNHKEKKLLIQRADKAGRSTIKRGSESCWSVSNALSRHLYKDLGWTDNMLIYGQVEDKDTLLFDLKTAIVRHAEPRKRSKHESSVGEECSAVPLFPQITSHFEDITHPGAAYE